MNFLHILAAIVAIIMLVLGVATIGWGIYNRKGSENETPVMLVAGVVLMLLCLIPGCIASGGGVV